MFKFAKEIDFIKSQFKSNIIQLHEPKFLGNEIEYLKRCIDSTFISSIGPYVTEFEKKLSQITGIKYAVATVNGTSALQLALKVIGVKPSDEVITQGLSFIATANSIVYNGALPIFLDVDLDTMGLSPFAVENFLKHNAQIIDGSCYNKKTKNKISACVPMHTFGFPMRINELKEVCDEWCIPIVEDSAEALGSKVGSEYVGSVGQISVYSFNGNKIITCGGGGAIVTNDLKLSEKSRFLSTTAKRKHDFEFIHDEIGFNFRMPNLNAAVALAQLENLHFFLKKKKELFNNYREFFSKSSINLKTPIKNSTSNNWLNAIELKNKHDRDKFLIECRENQINCRPIWRLLNENRPYKNCQTDELINSRYLEERIVNIPSSVN